MVFNTGLFTPLREPLFLYMERRRAARTRRNSDLGPLAEPRWLGKVTWWKNGTGEIRCEDAAAPQATVFVLHAQLRVVPGAASEVVVGQEVEFAIVPNPGRPGNFWAGDVTSPGGAPLPGAREKEFFGNQESVVTAAELETRHLGLVARDVLRATFCDPRDPLKQCVGR